jgi:hypothetical protein
MIASSALRSLWVDAVEKAGMRRPDRELAQRRAGIEGDQILPTELPTEIGEKRWRTVR